MKKVLLAIVVLALIAVALVAYSSAQPAAKLAPQTASAASPIKASNKVTAEAKVIPARYAALAFQAGGIVTQMPLALGDRVQAGQVLVRLDSKTLDLQLAREEANLVGAQARLNQLKRGPRAEELAAAQQSLVSAQAAYERLTNPNLNERVALKADVDKAEANLKRAQAAYDRIGGDSNPNSGMTMERAQLQSAYIDFDRALALYQNKITPPNAEVQQALAAIENAKSQIAKLKPTQDEVDAAQANVDAAKASRELIAEQIRNTKLVAPFDGVITSLDLKVGEYIAPGAPILRIADLSSWQVETTDLTELNVVRVRDGTSVTMTFDALPGLELTGKVTGIKPYGDSKQGDIVYTATIRPDRQDERLRWNMTAQVNMDAQLTGN